MMTTRRSRGCGTVLDGGHAVFFKLLAEISISLKYLRIDILFNVRLCICREKKSRKTWWDHRLEEAVRRRSRRIWRETRKLSGACFTGPVVKQRESAAKRSPEQSLSCPGQHIDRSEALDRSPWNNYWALFGRKLSIGYGLLYVVAASCWSGWWAWDRQIQEGE